MQSRDIFQLAVRILGLVFLYHGITSLGALIAMLMTAALPGLAAILVTGLNLLAAYWLLYGAPQIMRIAYPESAKKVT